MLNKCFCDCCCRIWGSFSLGPGAGEVSTSEDLVFGRNDILFLTFSHDYIYIRILAALNLISSLLLDLVKVLFIGYVGW